MVINFIQKLFDLRNSEIQTLKEQLQFERERVKELTDILVNIVQPKVVEAQTPVVVNPLAQTTGLWGRKRAILEERDRHEAAIKKNSELLGKPDDQLKEINKLEEELGVTEKEA